MKKLIAVLLCMLLALAPVAMAEGCDVKIGNISANIMGTEYALDGIELVFGVGSNDEGAGLHIAVKANGDTVADVALAANSEKILGYADGISDVYSIDLQTILDALNALMEEYELNSEGSMEKIGKIVSELAVKWVSSGEKIADILSGALKADGECEIDGEKAAKYTIFVSEEDAQAALSEICDRIGEVLEIAGQSESAQQLKALFNGNERLSANGTFAIGETKLEGKIALNARNTKTNEVTALVFTMDGNMMEEGKTVVITIDNALNIEAGGETENVMMSDITFYIVEGAFGGVVISAAAAGEDPTIISYQTPALQSEGITEYYFSHGGVELDILLGENVCKAIFSSMDEYVSLTFTPVDDSTFNVAVESNIGGEQISASLDAAVEQTDAAWLKTEAGETVDVLTISDEQVKKLQGEAILKGIGLLGTVAGSCEALAGLLTGMM